ncbi:MAG TPA: Fic family protein [Acidimicrobiales bacterium]|jgi:Fic family protein|nr:Fic family protein [Acidimicrobiales bacterium]
MFDEVAFNWNGQRARASVPPHLATIDLNLPESVVRSTERAAAAVVRSNDRLPPSWEPLARLLLRAEGVASSAVEQVRAPIEDVAAAEITDLIAGPSAWVADNLAVVTGAVEDARTRSLDIETLLSWHRRLMEHATTTTDARLVGRFRDRPVWIGGSTPLDAVYVGPPAEMILELMNDLVDFANSDSLDAITQAGVLHAQFESIHPFADGNGRLGRVLIGWVLVRRLRVHVPPPFSIFVARDHGGYLSGLTFYRMSELAHWVRWFAATLEKSASAASSLVNDVESLFDEWRQRARDGNGTGGRAVRSGATFWRVLELLPEYPIISAQFVADTFDISHEAARQMLLRFESLGILSPAPIHSTAPGRPIRWWAANELLAVVAHWS